PDGSMENMSLSSQSCFRVLSIQGHPNDKRRSLLFYGLKCNRPPMLLHPYRMGNRQPLPRTLAHLFGGKKRVEDPAMDLLGNARPGVGNTHLGPRASMACAHGDAAFPALPCADDIANRMRCIDNDVEEGLIHFSRETGNLREVGIKVQHHLRRILPLVAGDGDGALKALV